MLMPKIIEHMKKTGEWGNFFSQACNPFSYNESVAQLHYPKTKDEALAKGFTWRDETQSKSYRGPIYNIPDQISQVDQEITKQILICEVTGKPYKIIPQELKFYQQFQLPIPRRCPDQRRIDRLEKRQPRTLFDRNCAECQNPIQTTYAPDRPEKVLCEPCYLKEVY
ncbi:hypothetical protein IPJ72_05850 [Candidatus Peregrinibacteria bacterium]|nr:MAG: hypothetical protein IPJ72_05850 [Candidatus Peregrinibacteria bacterium]